MYNNDLIVFWCEVTWELSSLILPLELDLSDDGSFVQVFVDRPFLIDGRWVAKFYSCFAYSLIYV